MVCNILFMLILNGKTMLKIWRKQNNDPHGSFRNLLYLSSSMENLILEYLHWPLFTWTICRNIKWSDPSLFDFDLTS